MKRNQRFIIGIAVSNLLVICATICAMDSAQTGRRKNGEGNDRGQMVGGSSALGVGDFYGRRLIKRSNQPVGADNVAASKNGESTTLMDEKEKDHVNSVARRSVHFEETPEQLYIGREGKQDRYGISLAKKQDGTVKGVGPVPLAVPVPAKSGVMSGSTPIKKDGVGNGIGLPIADRVVDNNSAFTISPELIEQQRRLEERFAKKGIAKSDSAGISAAEKSPGSVKGEPVKLGVAGDDQEGFVTNLETNSQKPTEFDQKDIAAQEYIFKSIKAGQAAAKQGGAGANGVDALNQHGSSAKNGNDSRIAGTGSHTSESTNGSQQGTNPVNVPNERGKDLHAWSYEHCMKYMNDHRLMTVLCAMGIMAVPVLVYYTFVSADEVEKFEHDEDESKKKSGKKTGWLKGILKRGKRVLGNKKKVSFAVSS